MTYEVQHLTTRAWLVRRWPTALALPVVALSSWSMADGRDVGFVVVLAALAYLVAAILNRRGAAWWVAIGGTVPIAVARILDVDASVVLVAITVVGLLVAALRGWRGYGGQVLASVGFPLVAVLALATGPTVGGLLVAVGLFGHAAWDAYHHRTDRVVTRTYAEWCGVIDALLGVAVLVAIL